jgi:FlaA1/EpsC-like NDP-sugar epimerase
VRYGNVVGSRGSVIPLFLKQRATGTITVTDLRMTRFWITLEQAVKFVASCVEQLIGGEIFVPKIPTAAIAEIAAALAADCAIQVTGIRPGEKLHEVLINEDEARHTVSLPDRFLIQPLHPWWSIDAYPRGEPLPEGYRYGSDNNQHVLDAAAIRALIGRELVDA